MLCDLCSYLSILIELRGAQSRAASMTTACQPQQICVHGDKDQALILEFNGRITPTSHSRYYHHVCARLHLPRSSVVDLTILTSVHVLRERSTPRSHVRHYYVLQVARTSTNRGTSATRTTASTHMHPWCDGATRLENKIIVARHMQHAGVPQTAARRQHTYPETYDLVSAPFYSCI